MKLILFYNDFYQSTITLLKIESRNDVDDFITFMKQKEEIDIERYKELIKPSHAEVKTPVGAIVRYQNIAKLKKVDHLSDEERVFFSFFTSIMAQQYSDVYESSVREIFEKHGEVLINSSNAIFFGDLYEDAHNSGFEEIEIDSLKDYFLEQNLRLSENSDFLMLENDSTPDWRYKNIRKPLSSILNLAEVMAEPGMLKKFMQKYIEFGGKRKLFIHTSGNDIEQMREYLEVAKELDFDIEIVFNSKSLKEDKENLMKQFDVSYRFYFS